MSGLSVVSGGGSQLQLKRGSSARILNESISSLLTLKVILPRSHRTSIVPT
jgi:hypothetical protein